MRFLQAGLALVFSAAASWCQSASVTSPAANQSLSGTSVTFTCKLTSLPNAYTVQWIVDGADYALTAASPCALTTNTFYLFNSTQHIVHVIARDALGNTVATSPDVTFSTANSYPNGNPIKPSYLSLSVSTSMPTVSPWSGIVTVTPAVRGTGTRDSQTLNLFIDGIPGGPNGLYTGKGPYHVDTTILSNGTHLFEVVATDPLEKAGPFGQWGALVKVQNKSLSVHAAGNGLVYWDIDPIALKTSATPTLANAVANSGSSGSSVTCPAMSSTTGHAILVWAVGAPANANVSRVTDTSGNLYTQLSKISNGAPNAFGTWFSALHIKGNRSNVVTVHYNSSVDKPQVECLEYSNISGVDVNGSTSSNGTGTTGSPESLPFTTAQPNELVVVGLGMDRTVTGVVINPSFKIEASQTRSVVADRFVQSVASPNELVVTPREFPLAPGKTQQLTARIRNADGSFTANANVIWASKTPSVCTVSPNGLVSYAGFGACHITASGGGSLAVRSIWGWMGTTNAILNFGTDGKIYSNWTRGKSVWYADSFFSDAGFTDPYLSPNAFGSLYQLGYRNVIEGSVMNSTSWSSPPGGSESAFHAGLEGHLRSIKRNTQTVTPNFLVHGIGTSWVGGSGATWPGIFQNPGPGTTYSTPGWTYLAEQWASVLPGSSWSMADEVSNDWGAPQPHPTIQSSCPSDPNIDCFTQVACNGSTCIATWRNWTAEDYILFGATTNTCLDSTVGSSRVARPTNIDFDHFSFPNTKCGSIIATASTDPYLRFEPMIDKWEANGTDYFHYTGLTLLRKMVTDAGPGNFPLMGWAPRENAGTWANYHYCGDPSIGDFCEMYFTTCPGKQYTPLREVPTNCAMDDQGELFRNFWTELQGPRLWLAQSLGTNINFGNQGYPVNIISISGNTVTFASPICPQAPYLCNIIAEVTRGWIAGTSSSYYGSSTAVNWFIDSCPTATTCTISRAGPNTSDRGIYSGNIIFASGRTLASTGIAANGGVAGPMQLSPSLCPNPGDIGSIFTMSGTSSSYFQSNRFWAMINSIGGTSSTCAKNGGQPQLSWREVPPASYSATGGTMTILANNDAKMGIQAVSNSSRVGPRAVFMSNVVPAMYGAAGVRQYGLGKTWDYFVPGVWWSFQDKIDWTNQAQVHPYWSSGDADQTTPFWYSATAHMLHERLAKYLFQPRCSGAPDPGAQFEVALRCGPYGNLLMVANASDYAQTRQIDLSGCVVRGQSTIRYLGDGRGVDVSVIAAGIASDTPTIKDAGVAYYLCSNNEAAELQQPAVSVRIADVANATRAVVRYAYAPFLLPLRDDNLVPLTGGVGTLPVDRTLGPLFYQVLYLAADGRVLAVSDIQKL